MNPTNRPVINQIEDAVKDVPGWSPVDQLFALFCLAYSTADLEGDILEVGSWCGRSSVALGLAAKLSGTGVVHCVDLFPDRDDWSRNEDGSYSLQVQIDGRKYGGYCEQTVWADAFEQGIAPVYAKCPSLMHAFNETVSKCGVDSVVFPFRGDLVSFRRSKPRGMRCRMAFLDGDHGYTAVCQDIAQVEELLVPGGWICFDDAFSGYTGVDRAIQEKILGNPHFELGHQLTRKFFVAKRRLAVNGLT